MDDALNILNRFETARAKAMDAEARNLSQATQRKRWREFFAAEDALKARDGWR